MKYILLDASINDNMLGILRLSFRPLPSNSFHEKRGRLSPQMSALRHPAGLPSNQVALQQARQAEQGGT